MTEGASTVHGSWTQCFLKAGGTGRWSGSVQTLKSAFRSLSRRALHMTLRCHSRPLTEAVLLPPHSKTLRAVWGLSLVSCPNHSAQNAGRTGSKTEFFWHLGHRFSSRKTVFWKLFSLRESSEKFWLNRFVLRWSDVSLGRLWYWRARKGEQMKRPVQPACWGATAGRVRPCPGAHWLNTRAVSRVAGGHYGTAACTRSVCEDDYLCYT